MSYDISFKVKVEGKDIYIYIYPYRRLYSKYNLEFKRDDSCFYWA